MLVLVWNAPQGASSVFTMGGTDPSCDVHSGYESYLCFVNRIIRRGCNQFILLPGKLSAAMIGAFKAVAGRIANSVETSYAQWTQFVVCSVLAVDRRSSAASTKSILMTLTRAVGRVKAFFMSKKVNGRNAP